MRALEVFETLGRPISQLQKHRRGLSSEYNVRIFCLDMQRSKLYSHIERRVEQMFEKGLLTEVRRVLKLRLSRTARHAIGLGELKGYFEGEYGLEEARRQMKKNTRNYAKRQLTWFRKDKRVEWIKLKDRETPEGIARRIIARLDF